MQNDINFKITFELDYAHHTKYKVTITNGEVCFEDDIPSSYMPMLATLNTEAGEKNGNYNSDPIAQNKILDFIDNHIVNWKCYYPNTVCDQYDKWRLHIEFEDLEILTSGYGDKPENFYDFLKLINNILPKQKEKNAMWIDFLD